VIQKSAETRIAFRIKGFIIEFRIGIE